MSDKGASNAGSSEGNVVEFPKAGEKYPIQFSFRYALGDGRELGAIVAYDPDKAGTPDKLLDQISDWINRQRARTEIVTLTEAIEEKTDEIARIKSQAREAAVSYQAQIDKLEPDYRAAKAEYETTFDKLRDAEEATGRRDFDPSKAGNKAKLEVHIRNQEKIAEQVTKLREDMKVADGNFMATMAMHEDAIKKLNLKLAARKAIVGL